MPLVDTSTLDPSTRHPANDQIYCGLDAAITLEIFEELHQLFAEPPIVYHFEVALQAPALEMALRGFKVDLAVRERTIGDLRAKLSRYDEVLQTFAQEVWGRPLKPRSFKQLREFFYEKMRLPEHWISQKGERKISFNREVLEKLEIYLHARPIVACILAIREIGKDLSVLESGVDPDGRLRTSWNIGGTETGRWSSSANAHGTGTNLQNIKHELRSMFVSDPGWTLCGIDLEQAESREVGWLQGTLFQDWRYLDACERGDLHSTVSQLIWPGQDPRASFYRHFSRRDMAKRGGHLTNYMGTAWTASRSLKVPLSLMETFQKNYLNAFPGFTRWWQWTAQRLQVHRELTTPFGRRRHFFGRPNDSATLREAIAFSPQSSTADRTNLGLWRIWHEFGPRVQLLANGYDALYFQFRSNDNAREIISRSLELMDVPLSCGSRVLHVPGEAKVGTNWGPWSEDNPEGLKKWTV